MTKIRKLVISIEFGNAAFGEDDYQATEEVGRILEQLAARMRNTGLPSPGIDLGLLDLNGNNVGSVKAMR